MASSPCLLTNALEFPRRKAAALVRYCPASASQQFHHQALFLQGNPQLGIALLAALRRSHRDHEGHNPYIAARENRHGMPH